MKRILLATLIPFLAACGSGKKGETVRLSPIIEKALNDESSRFYADFSKFPAEKRNLPIGVFDSGTGGLTVLEVMLTIDQIDNITGKPGSDGIPDFAGENFTFMGDMANMPYGNYAAENKNEFFKELVVKDALFLLGNKYWLSAIDKEAGGVKEPSKIIVIACNTATAWGLKSIDTLLAKSNTGVKVIGVINAGVNALFRALENGPAEDSVAVGVLATVGTIASDAYSRTIKEVKAKLGYPGEIRVVNHACAGFAESVDMEKDFNDPSATAPRESYRGPEIGETENDINLELLRLYNFCFENNALLVGTKDGKITEMQLNSAANYARFHLVNLLEKHRKSGSTVPLQHIILGCTHYPFLLDTLKTALQELKDYKVNGQAIYRELISDSLTFIDPAVFTAIECYNTLRADNNLALRTEDGKVDAYISVPAYGLDADKLDGNGNLSYAYKYGREAGTEELSTLFVPLSGRYITKENMERLQALVPNSYRKITENGN